MEVGLFVLGILVGVGLTWYLLERYRRDEAAEREANFNARLAALQDELRESDAALAETKDRLIAMQMEHRAADAAPAAGGGAGAGQARRRAGDRAGDAAARGQPSSKNDCRRHARVTRGHASGRPVADCAHSGRAHSETLDRTISPRSGGIGKVIERKLHELGITSFGQIAALTPDEVRRVNDAIEFPGRVEREHWIDAGAAELART